MKLISKNNVFTRTFSNTTDVYFTPIIQTQHAQSVIIDTSAIRIGVSNSTVNFQIQASNDQINWRTMVSFNITAAAANTNRLDDYNPAGYLYFRVRVAKTSNGIIQAFARVDVTTKGHPMNYFCRVYDYTDPITTGISYTEELEVMNQHMVGFIGSYTAVGAVGNIRLEGSNNKQLWEAVPSNPVSTTHTLSAGGSSFAITNIFYPYKYIRIRIFLSAGSITTLNMSLALKGY